MRFILGLIIAVGFLLSFSAQAVEVESFGDAVPCPQGGLLWDATAAAWGSSQGVWTLGRHSATMGGDPNDCYGRATYTAANTGEALAGKGFPVNPSTTYTVSFYARHRPDRTWGSAGDIWFEVDYAWGDHNSVWVRDVGPVTQMLKWTQADTFDINWALFSDTTDEDSGSNTHITLALKAGSVGGGVSIPHIDKLDLAETVSVYDWSVY